MARPKVEKEEVNQPETAKEEASKKKEAVAEAEYERRTHLDVSDRDYINPSLDHVKVK